MTPPIRVHLTGGEQGRCLDADLTATRTTQVARRAYPTFRWKFSLHPSFWHVLTLRRMLESLRSSSPEVCSAPGFEGAMHGAGRSVDPLLLERTYRVRGDGFTARGRWFESRGVRALTRQLIRPVRLAARLGGPRRVATVDTALMPYHRCANGPYPMFWSGLVRQGRLHQEALGFLAWTGQSALADDVRRSLGSA
jgi:hypothetical protein